MENSETIKITQKIMMNYLRKKINNDEILNQISIFLEKFPIVQSEEGDEFLKSQGSTAQMLKMRDVGSVILLKTDIDSTIQNIITIIHEYAHALSEKFSSTGTKFGNMAINIIFEEAMAVNFSEACINEWIKDTNMFEDYKNGIVERKKIYKEEREMLNSLLFILSEKKLDDVAMLEYLIGDKERFCLLCSEQLGPVFGDIVTTMETIILQNNSFNGFGFRNKEIIKQLCDFASKKLEKLVKEESSLYPTGNIYNFINPVNRYIFVSKTLKKKYFQEVMSKELIKNGEFSVEEVKDLLLFYDFEYLNKDELKRVSNELQIWLKENDFKLLELMQLGITSQDIIPLMDHYDAETGEKLNRKLRTQEFIRDFIESQKVNNNEEITSSRKI